MKNLLKILAFSLIITVFNSCGGNETPVMKTAQLSIEGMSCAHSCAPTIQEKLSSVEGVKEAKVSFETKQADVTFDENKVSKEDLKAAVETVAEGAYTVTAIK
ncbi:MAG: heavy-metal-associated domain-containing protein [Flavobacteriales bacterium]